MSHIEEEKVIFCNICQSSYVYKSHNDAVRHKTSMLHLISASTIERTNVLRRPRSSSKLYPKGYRLLKREGWDGISGLGKRETGIAEPIVAYTSANDRAGLGAAACASKVSRKDREIKLCNTMDSRRETSEELQIKWKRLKLELATDFSDEHIEQLLAPEKQGNFKKPWKTRKKKRKRHKS